MANKEYKRFAHRGCEYFPCHKGIAEEEFNCLFCYCPLYLLGEDCGGDFTYTSSGAKNCAGCTLPHMAGGYEYVTEKLAKVIKERKKK